MDKGHKLPDAGFIVKGLKTFIPVSNSANILSNGIISIVYMGPLPEKA